jgi:hypothetical protein
MQQQNDWPGLRTSLCIKNAKAIGFNRANRGPCYRNFTRNELRRSCQDVLLTPNRRPLTLRLPAADAEAFTDGASRLPDSKVPKI